MAALTAPYDAKRKESELVAYPVAANTKCYKGGLIALSGGYAQPASDGAGLQFVGVAAETADNGTGDIQPGSIAPSIGSQPVLLPSGIAQGVAGAITVRVYKEGAFVFNKAAAVATDVGKQAFVSDDNTVSTAATGHNVACGSVTELIDATQVRVRIDLAVN